MDGRRDRRLQGGERRLDRFDGADDVHAGDLEHDEKDAALAVGPPGLCRVGRSHDRLTDVSDPDGRAVSIGDDDVIPRLGARQLIVVVDRKRLFVSQDRAFGIIHGGDADLRPHVFELEALLDKSGGIDLDAHRRRHLAADAHQRHAGNLADALGEDILRGVVDIDDWRDIGFDGEDEDGRVGGIDLSIGRRTRQVFRQLSGGGVDRGLDIVGGGVDVAVEIELDGDRGRAKRTRRRHLGDARNLRDLAFERLRDRCGHGVRRCSGQLSRDGDGRKIDLRQRRDGQRRKRDQADQQNGDHNQRRRDRTTDERSGDATVHSASSQVPCRS